jgi:O-antigen ligase
LVVLAGFFLYGSGSKAAWAGLVVAFVSLWVYAIVYRRNKSSLLIITIAGIVLSLVVWTYGDYVKLRVEQDTKTISRLVEGDFLEAKDETGSLAVRLELWQQGVSASLARPILGWGSNAVDIIKLSDYDLQIGHGHFHNLYLEIFASFGLVGLVGIGLFHYILFKSLMARLKYKDLGEPVLFAAFFAGISSITVLFFAIRIGQTEGRSFLTLLFAFYAAAMYLNKLGAKQRPKVAPRGQGEFISSVNIRNTRQPERKK